MEILQETQTIKTKLKINNQTSKQTTKHPNKQPKSQRNNQKAKQTTKHTNTIIYNLKFIYTTVNL